MPTTLPPDARRLRRDLADLTGLANKDLGIVWANVDSLDTAKAALNDVLPRLITLYGSAASALAADWYDEVRDAAQVKGRFSAIVADLPANTGAESLAGYGVGPLAQAKPDFDSALTLVVGGLQRRIANQARQTIMDSSLSDPAATGWQRVGEGECKQGFCDMLIARGAVYTEATADFAAHDHCQCSAVPAFGGRSRPVKPFTPALTQATDADKARLRDYLRDNHQSSRL